MAIELRPVSGHVGVDVRGVDLSKPIDDETAKGLRQAFLDHHLLLFRNQDISADDQFRFASLFGEAKIRGKYARAAAEPATQYVSNTRTDGILGDGEIAFHQDHVFYEHPLRAIILYGVQIPPSGSATRFRNAVTLVDRMPDKLRRRCEPVRCLHLYDYNGDYTAWQDPAKASPDAPRAWHPLLWTHPETGQLALWLSPLNTVDFAGATRDEGWALIDELKSYADAADDLVYQHEWAPGDLVIWSNRTLQHARLPFIPGEARTLRRTPIV
jgi:alpha-ketoglutarate-dependent taurine dioxygenase